MAAPRKKKLKTTAILAIIIAVQVLVLGGLTAYCLPYLNPDEDPETILREDPPATTEGAEPLDQQLPPPEKNPYGPLDFQFEGRFLSCLKEDTIPGIDVSYHQGKIDWEQVAASGVKFAMIRVGYRGYGTGKLVEDERYLENITGALNAGLDVGVYFFSQALNVEEAIEEADFLLERIAEHNITMPVVFDWEPVSDEARTANMDPRTLTDCCLAFCEYMEEKGYTPMSYFNTYQSRNDIYIKELERWPYWLALYKNRMTFPYEVEMWQYTCTGRVPGIAGDVDINLYFP